MDAHDVAADLREAVLTADAFQSAQIDEPFDDAAGFVLDYPKGRFLVTVVQIGD